MSSNSFASRRRFPSARRARISSGAPSPSQDQPVAMQHPLASRSTIETLLACPNTPEESCQHSPLTDPEKNSNVQSQKSKAFNSNFLSLINSV